jgi:esterase
MKLFYRKYGEGPPLMILHGLYGSSDNWVTIAKAVGRKYTVYLPDLRNHGLSPHSDLHDYDSLSKDIFELAGELGLEKFFLAGHSMGGKTAAFFAVKWPGKIQGLVIADISPFAATDIRTPEYIQHLSILKTLIDTDILSAGSRSDVETLLRGKITSARTRGMIMKNLQRMPDNKFSWKINAPALLKNLEKIMSGLPRPLVNYPVVTGFPVLFLKGENSGYLPASDQGDILKVFPAAEIQIIRNAGHWIHSDNPGAVIKALVDFGDH